MFRTGLQIPSFTYPGVGSGTLFETVNAIAETAERAGFGSIWVMDHFHQIMGVGRPDEPIMEAYTTLSALAARTSSVKLGALVTGVTYRNPALLAKMATTLDVISGGRAILGIGGAWNEDEHIAYNFPFPPARERLDRMEEAILVCRAMFDASPASFSGGYYSIKDALNVPRPVQKRLPILVGGGGEKRTLRIVAEHADGCNLFGDIATIKHKLSVLDAHCSAAGRDPRAVTRTRLGTLVIASTQAEAEAKMAALPFPEPYKATIVCGSPERVAEQARAFLEAGLDGLIFNMVDAYNLESVAMAGEALAKI